jgi:hypothetical protein
MTNPYGFPQYVIDRVMAKRGRLTVFDHFDPKHTALLVVDMQNFYVGETASVVDIIPNINRIANTLREAGGRVIWIGMSAGKDGTSDWRIYHDHFFTPDKANTHRDQLTLVTPVTRFIRLSTSATATTLSTSAASARSSAELPTLRMC